MIKLIVSDVDGTLVEDGGNYIKPRFFEVVHELKKRGIVFVACSGRGITSLKNIFKPVKDDIILCGENGGYIKCREHIVYQNFIDEDDVKELIYESRNMEEIVTCLCTPDVMYIERAGINEFNWLNEGYEIKAELVEDLFTVNLKNVIKFSILDKIGVGKNSGILLNKKWREKMFVTEAGMEWLDITNKDVNKGKAVSEIQRYLGIKKEETVIFGDNHNDIPMFSFAKYGFAVKNAREEVIDVADYITDSNKDDGVLNILEKILKDDYNFKNKKSC